MDCMQQPAELNERNPGCLEIISKPFFERANHGACLAHILRELQGLVEQGSAWAGVMHAFLWHLYEQAQPLPGEARLRRPGMLSADRE